jgi:ATP-dependent helicase/nuclease subunit B
VPELRLIIERAGSGKTHSILDEVCRRAATAPLSSVEHPPLLVIVPEQQALQTEEALLLRLAQLLGRPAATSRIRVMSLSRLGNWLCSQAGQPLRRDGDMGRRLLIWRILGEMEGLEQRSGRQARVEQLSEVLAELRQFGTMPADLRARAVELAALPTQSRSAEELPKRLEELAELLERYLSACEERGLSFPASALQIPRLLSSRLWPYLEQTEVFIDGFAGFTPPEEQAILAILSRTRSLTGAILLDPERIEQPLPQDSADWFAPGRQLYRSLIELGRRCGLSPRIAALTSSPRWRGTAEPLAQLAEHGALPAARIDQAIPLQFSVCNDERTEVLEAVRTVRRLMREQGLRPSEISIIARDLEPYAELLTARLREHGIPAFIDLRATLSYHPLLQLVRGLLRVASGQAGREELAGLLRCGLLPFTDDDIAQQAAVDKLLKYSDGRGLSVARWLDPADWNWHRELSVDEGRARRRDAAEVRAELQQFDAWRRQLMAPALLLQDCLADESLTLDQLVASLRDCLPAADDARLRPDSPDALVRERVLDLLAEMELLGAGLPLRGERALELRDVINWLEYGFGRLQQAMPPLRQEQLLVTEVERGRHHPVRASILIGLADGNWPALATDSPWFSDRQRELINGPGRLVSSGSRDACEREPWLAMIALTRASERLLLLRPGADSEGRRRPPSPWYGGLLHWSGATEQAVSYEDSLAIEHVESEGDLVLATALAGRPPDSLPGLSGTVQRALAWAHERRRLRRQEQNLTAPLLQRLAGASGNPAILSCSATRLESFAACPYKHYVRYWLRLDEDREPAFDALTLGNMYHSVFERTVKRLSAEGYDWLGADWQRISECSRRELELLRSDLFHETASERVDYVLQRAGLLLEQHSRRMSQWLQENDNRQPLQTELRFGGREAQLPPYIVRTVAGELRISGFIDRLDLDGEGRATVVDYKLGGQKQLWNRLLAGYQLQLFVYMLAIRGHSVAGSPALEPRDAEFQPLEVQWDSRDGRADFSASQALRPAGRQTDNSENVRRRLHGWALDETRRVLGELGQRLLSGEVRAWPLEDGNSWTACSNCSYRSVCRFDPAAGDTYRSMLPLGNQALQSLIMEGEPDFSGSAQRSSALPDSGGSDV